MNQYQKSYLLDKANAYLKKGESVNDLIICTDYNLETQEKLNNIIHNLSKAIRYFSQVIKFYPESTEEVKPLLINSYELCRLYYMIKLNENENKENSNNNFRRKFFLKNINISNKAIKIDSTNASLYLCRADGYSGLKKYRDAINDYTKAIDLNNNDISYTYLDLAYAHRGNCYYSIGEYDKALQDLSFLKANFKIFENNELSLYTNRKIEASIFEDKRNFYKSLHTLIFITIITKPNCPNFFFLKVLEIIFELKNFKFYGANFLKEAECSDILYKEKNDELFFIKSKLNFLENISKELTKETFFLSREKYEVNFNKHINLMLLFFKIYNMLQKKYQEVIEKKEQEKAQAKIDERNKVIADLSHSIKNLISSVIDPLENLKKEVIAKQPIIDSAIKGANLVREIVNSMNLSYKGSIEDFRYDAKNNHAGDRQNVKTIIIESLKNAVANMYDGKYFSSFQEGYFPKKEIYLESKSNWTSITQSKSSDELCQFLHDHFFDLIISIENTERLIIGNEKGSVVKLLILFGELILNAVKYSAFVNRENRFVKIEILYNSKDISVLVENPFNPRKKIKTTGLGNVVITNFAKLLNTSPVINRENDIYSIKITFENFWQKDSSV